MAARILVLGGTTEATAVGAALQGLGHQVITSFAGATSTRADRPGSVRVGGFGGIDGLVRYLEAERIGLVLDATHPFAAVMPFHAQAAADRTGTPHVRLLRPPWLAEPADRWVEAADLDDAATRLATMAPRRVLLTVGRRSLEPFRGAPGHWYLVRSIEPAPIPLADSLELLGRGPFTVESEVALLDQHAVDLVVAKNAGGAATQAKVVAARRRGIEVLMVARPPGPPETRVVETVDQALEWVARLDQA